VRRSPRPESNRRPPDSKSGVPRQRRLRGYAQPSLWLHGSCQRHSVDTSTGPPGHTTLKYDWNPERRGHHPSQSASGAELSLGRCGRQTRVPPPRAGTPREGPSYAGRYVRTSPERVALSDSARPHVQRLGSDFSGYWSWRNWPTTRPAAKRERASRGAVWVGIIVRTDLNYGFVEDSTQMSIRRLY